jgi:hypothetical protein
MGRPVRERPPSLRALVILLVAGYAVIAVVYNRPKHSTLKEANLAGSGDQEAVLVAARTQFAAVQAVHALRSGALSAETLPQQSDASRAATTSMLELRSALAAKAAADTTSSFSRAASLSGEKNGAFRAATAAATMYIGQQLAEAPPIILGGTDGSGTRGAVALLLSLGVEEHQNARLQLEFILYSRAGQPS